MADFSLFLFHKGTESVNAIDPLKLEQSLNHLLLYKALLNSLLLFDKADMESRIRTLDAQTFDYPGILHFQLTFFLKLVVSLFLGAPWNRKSTYVVLLLPWMSVLKWVHFQISQNEIRAIILPSTPCQTFLLLPRYFPCPSLQINL